MGILASMEGLRISSAMNPVIEIKVHVKLARASIHVSTYSTGFQADRLQKYIPESNVVNWEISQVEAA